MISFIDDVTVRYGVEPVRRVLAEHGVRIAPRTYYAQRTRPPSARVQRDERVLAEFERIHADPQIGRGLYGVRKVHAQLVREDGVDGQPVSRRQVERLMRRAGLQGNAQAESLIGLYKLECVRREGPWRAVEDLELATLSWVHWFNHQPPHSNIGYLPPVEYEAEYYRQNPPVQHQLPGEPALH